MEYKKIMIFMALVLLLVTTATAKDLTPIDLGEIKDKPDLKTLDPMQVKLTDKLDDSFIVNDNGSYHKGLKQITPIVFIDKKVGDIYHVDSLRDFIINETVTLEFFYDVQPDWIKHYKHSGEFDRTYLPNQWEWVGNCTGNDEYEVCNGGVVTLIVTNIDEGFGSNTFPIGITGPQWVILNQTLLVSGVDYNAEDKTFTLLNEDLSWSGINASYGYQIRPSTSSTTVLRLTGIFIVLSILSVLMIPLIKLTLNNSGKKKNGK